MSDFTNAQPPSYDDAMKASAPPSDGGMNQPPYPVASQPPYPVANQPSYPTNVQQPVPYPLPPQQTYPSTNYGAAPNPTYPPPQQYPQQTGYRAPISGAPGQYNYNTVTVVANQGAVGRPVVGGPVVINPVPALTSAQLQAHQRNRRRMCYVTIAIFVGIIVLFIIIAYGPGYPTSSRWLPSEQRNRRRLFVGIILFIVGVIIFIIFRVAVW